VLIKALLVLTACTLAPVAKAALVATYIFNGDLNAQQGGVAPLVAIDPLGTSGFQTVTVFGNSRNTYHFNGNASPASQQGGLQMDTNGLLGVNNYSVEIVFELADRDFAWRRVMDSLDRTSDSGLYIDFSNHIDVFPAGGSGDTFTPSTFFDVFVTVDASNNIVGYFSGVQQLSLNSTVLNINTHFLNFFLDNTVGGGQGEWSQGNVALIKVFDTALTASQVATETEDPFVGTNTPEPSSWLLMLAGAAALLSRDRRKRLVADDRRP
jgi:hypothetical protein